MNKISIIINLTLNKKFKYKNSLTHFGHLVTSNRTRIYLGQIVLIEIIFLTLAKFARNWT